MKYKMIGVTGYARSGKDTFVNYAQRILREKDIICPRVAFADKLKHNINSWLVNNMGITAWTRNDTEKSIIRPILVGYGEGMRKIDENYWVDSIRDSITTAIGAGICPILSDVRYENEAQFVKEMGGALIKVTREGVVAPNNSELNNQVLVDKYIDFNCSWPSFESNIDLCSPYVEAALTSIDFFS